MLAEEEREPEQSSTLCLQVRKEVLVHALKDLFSGAKVHPHICPLPEAVALHSSPNPYP